MTQLDHIIFAVTDLARATSDLSLMLGRAPSWQGIHPNGGTANSLFRLDNTYIELLAPIGEGHYADFMLQHIEAKGEGLCGLIFAVDDLAALADKMRRENIAVSEIMAGRGEDQNTGAVRQWQHFMWPAEVARGIFSFAIRHNDPNNLPLAPVEGTGAIMAVDHVVVQTKSAHAAKDFYGDMLGIRLARQLSRPQWGGDMLFFRLSSLSIEVIAADKHKSDEDHLWGIAFRVDDVAATQQRLKDAGVEVSDVRDGRKPGTKVMTVKSHCLNIPTLLIEHQG